MLMQQKVAVQCEKGQRRNHAEHAAELLSGRRAGSDLYGIFKLSRMRGVFVGKLQRHRAREASTIGHGLPRVL